MLLMAIVATSIVEGSIPNRTSVLSEDQALESIGDLDISDDDLSSMTDTESVSSQDAHSVSEVAELRRAIKDTITNLFRMSVVIRNPTPRGRYRLSKNNFEQTALFSAPQTAVTTRSKGKETDRGRMDTSRELDRTSSWWSGLRDLSPEPRREFDSTSQRNDFRNII